MVRFNLVNKVLGHLAIPGRKVSQLTKSEALKLEEIVSNVLSKGVDSAFSESDLGELEKLHVRVESLASSKGLVAIWRAISLCVQTVSAESLLNKIPQPLLKMQATLLLAAKELSVRDFAVDLKQEMKKDPHPGLLITDELYQDLTRPAVTLSVGKTSCAFVICKDVLPRTDSDSDKKTIHSDSEYSDTQQSELKRQVSPEPVTAATSLDFFERLIDVEVGNRALTKKIMYLAGQWVLAHMLMPLQLKVGDKGYNIHGSKRELKVFRDDNGVRCELTWSPELQETATGNNVCELSVTAVFQFNRKGSIQLLSHRITIGGAVATGP